ncbi:Mediator of RNA polymerase II transcription subunit 7 [Entomophthora muscae]|uniref:Mediator of RNA polymerase II transcription subunit 7 n=1 Tax=Entomophthora muscae TaxID=34485 RepID=A0ACC2RDL6_9FUNG|nr:Mediator of RNA polymerase II transcription subunit 7 [Entomophthora muscae]
MRKNWEKIKPYLPKYGIEGSDDAPSEDTLPIELNNLLPPSIPENCTEYVVFGRTFKLNEDFPPLKDLGIKLFYTTFEENDLVKELKGLNRSVFDQFIELVQHIIDVPASDEPESELDTLMDKLNVTLLNMMQMVNRLRPSQARATLHQILEKRRAHFQSLASSAYKSCSDILSKASELQSQLDLNTSLNEIFASASKISEAPEFNSRFVKNIPNSPLSSIVYIDDDPYLEQLLKSVS